MSFDNMKLITTESILAALFKYGFNRIDQLLYIFTLERIAYITAKDKNIVIAYDADPSTPFSVFCSDPIKEQTYRFNEKYRDKLEYSLNSEGTNLALEYINKIDFVEIVEKKMKALGITKDEAQNSSYFCEKEKEIIRLEDEKTQKLLNEMMEKQRIRVEEIEKMASSTEYIEWLIEFTEKNNGGFYIDDWDYNSGKISISDKEKVEKIPLFFELVSEYVEHHPCNGGYFCKIKYNDEALHVGVLEGQGSGDHFVNAVSKTDGMGNPKFGYDVGCTDYKVVMEKYKKYHGIEKTKEYKKD